MTSYVEEESDELYDIAGFKEFKELFLQYVYSENSNFGASTQSRFEIALYVFLGLFGLLGNLSTCLVIGRNRSMHTVTNVYLFNLAISDLLILIFCLPPLSQYVKYRRMDALCKFRTLMCEWSVYVSVLTITAFSVERYLAICHPFQARALSEMSRASRTIPVIWLFGFICALPMSLQTGLVELFVADETDPVCTVINDLAPRAFEISTLLFFVLPMLLMGCLYTRMAMSLRKSASVVREQRKDDEVNANGRRAIVMLVMVAVAFFVCWAPYQVQRLFTIHFRHNVLPDSLIEVQLIISHVIGVLYYSSGCINPIIYNIMSKKFRQAFKETFIGDSKILRCNRCVRANDRQHVVVKI